MYIFIRHLIPDGPILSCVCLWAVREFALMAPAFVDTGKTMMTAWGLGTVYL